VVKKQIDFNISFIIARLGMWNLHTWDLILCPALQQNSGFYSLCTATYFNVWSLGI